MKNTPFFLMVCLVCLLSAVTCAGCTSKENLPGQTLQPSPVGTAVPVGHLVVTEEQDKDFQC